MRLRRKCYILFFLSFALLFTICLPGLAVDENNKSEIVYPASTTHNDYTKKIAAGSYHNLVVKPDGTASAWGWNLYGQTNVPISLTGVVAVAVGDYHSYALKSDGTVVHWGMSQYGQASIPTDLNDAVAITSGASFGLALRSDGTVAAWGNNGGGQTNVPADLSNVAAIAAGSVHGLALKNDGMVVAWGSNYYGQTSIPEGLNGVVAIAAGATHSLALKSDGTVVAWGANDSGQTNIPAGLTDVKAIAGGTTHSLALKFDGTVIAWGGNDSGQTDIPADLNGVIAVDAGGAHSMALKDDGTVVVWGNNSYGQTNVPAGLNLLPTIVTGASTDYNGSLVMLSFNKDMADPDGCHSQFVVTANGTNISVASAALDTDHKKIILTLSGLLKYQEAVTVSYIPGTIGSANGQLLEAFGDQTVINNVTETPLLDGIGIITADPRAALTGSEITFVFTYHPISNEMINGAVTLELPDGWSIPAAENITSNKGNVVVNERTINISGLTILKTDELKITFNNVAVPASIGPYTFITKQKSSANGVLTALGYSPQLYVISEPGPIAVFSISSELVIAGEVLTLDASRSFHSEPDHSIVRYEWDYDCPMGLPVDFHIQSQGQEVQHRFDQAGTFTIVLKAVDDTGKASYALKTVYVDIVNVPSADPGGSYEISRGNELILDGSKSTDPDIYYGDCITKYSWDINGDGIFDIITDQAQANVSWADLQTICGLPSNFSNNYTFTVILEVTDCTDRTAESQTTLTITNTVDGCFIATASFGSKLEPAVVLLRQFRDKCLLTNVWGQKFVKFYYHHSPPIAGLIAGSEPLRIFFRVLLLPFIAIAYTALHPCLIIWAVCLIIFLGLYRLITRTSGH